MIQGLRLSQTYRNQHGQQKKPKKQKQAHTLTLQRLLFDSLYIIQ